MWWRANGTYIIIHSITIRSVVVTVNITARGGVAMAVLYSSSSPRLCAPFDLGDGGRSRQDCSVSLDLDLYIYMYM